MTVKEMLEQVELQNLSKFAAKSLYSKGRETNPSDTTRTEFQGPGPDHPFKGFRRLQFKTQVFWRRKAIITAPASPIHWKWRR